MKKLLLSLFAFTVFGVLPAQVFINEVSGAGYAGFADEDGDNKDWIEFYNAGPAAVNLGGYEIVCNEGTDSRSWTFPTIFIQPGEYLTVFFSGKNRRDYFDHWEVPVYPQQPWRYFPGIFQPAANWAAPGFNDASWLLAQGPIGYGDGDDATTISPTISLYQRASFTCADTGNIVMAAFLVDFDDAFVAYLNGKEIARYNVGAAHVPCAYNDYAFDDHEAQQYQNGNWSGLFFIPSYMLDTILLQGTNTLAVETHNAQTGMDDMTMYPALLLGVADTSVTFAPFPADVNLHTDFSLNSTGQQLILKNAVGGIVDSITIAGMQINHTRGRQPDGSPNWCLFSQPTPDTSNFSLSCYSGYGASPVISLTSGFYNGTPATTITTPTAGTIHYTLNGQDPQTWSPAYTSAVSIDSTLVLRAKLIPTDTTYLPGPVAAASYFINENVTLPVVSITTDPYNLFDQNYGIYMLNTPDTAFADIPFEDANFWQGWIRPCNVAFFDTTHVLQFETPASIRIQGNWSKVFAQKGFFIDCDDDYGAKPLDYQLFPDKPATEYRGFNLRNAGSDYNKCHLRDRMIHKTIQPVCDVDMMDGFACVVFINGEYWGVYELREKQDKHYLANNSECDDDSTDFLQFDGDIIEGDNKHFIETYSFIGGNDMTQQANIDSAAALWDFENFCDYFIIETFYANTDWLGSYTNNIKFWRPRNYPAPWRYVLWDLDLALNSDTVNMLARAINPPVSNPHSVMLNSLLQNDSFRIYFVNRYADLLNTTFYPYNTYNYVVATYLEMLPEMDRHFGKWGVGGPPLYTPSWAQWQMDTAEWTQNVIDMANVMFARPYYVRQQIQNQFSLPQQIITTFDVFPSGAGNVRLNTITLDSVPWQGIYFTGNPVTMTALPNSGFVFLYWEYALPGDTTRHYNRTLRIDVDSAEYFRAVFGQLAPPQNSLTVFPNPFADNITINYSIAERGAVTIRIFDVTGRLVAEPLPSSSYVNPGSYSLQLNAAELALAGGVYFVELRSGEYRETQKIVSGRPEP
jgi:hypothetical protein